MYRRTVSLATALLLVAGISRAGAQASVHQRPALGILAGVNFATLSGSSVEQVSNRAGFIGGGFATFHVANGFGIEPELLFSMAGATSGNGSGSGGEVGIRLDYVQVPVLARYDFNATSGTHPFVVAGPSFAVQANCKATAGSVSADCESAGFNSTSFDLGGTIGAGVMFRMSRQSVSLGARYTIGANDVFENSFHAKNHVLSVLAGISF